MKVIFSLLSLFILTSCSLSQGIQRNYIISHSQNEEISTEIVDENNDDEEYLSLAE